MDKAELNALFNQKLKELKGRDSTRGRLVEAEIDTLVRIIPASPGESTWDLLYRQIRHLSAVHRISEEQAIHELFTPGSAQSFLMLRAD